MRNVLPSMRSWYEAEVLAPAKIEKDRIMAKAQEYEQRRIARIVRTPAMELEVRAIAAISPDRVTYCPGIPTKRFARQIQGETELTENQRQYLWGIVWRFRRQIRDVELVRTAEMRKEAA